MNIILQIILVSIAPISELKGGIPLAIASGFSPINAFLIATLANIAIIPVFFLFLDTLNILLLKLPIYSRFFNRTLEKARNKVHKSLEKYGYLGLAIFVAIPLPFFGVYTGVLGAWALGMNKRKSFASTAVGTIIAGILVTIISYYGMRLFL
jgi:uncharacterized membrane protein